MSEKYTYQVARIRALEVNLFSNGTVDQLIACPDYRSAVRFLEERGWGSADTGGDAEAILDAEDRKIWQLVDELKIDRSNFDVLSLPKRFQNLKSAVKEAVTGRSGLHIYYEDVEPGGTAMRDIIAGRDFSALPANMQAAAGEAYDTMLHTGDGQLCDVIIDKACLEAIYAAGRAAGSDIIRDYAESVVAVADIKTAVRSQKTGKSQDFIKRALAECDSLNTDGLARAATAGPDELKNYLAQTAYAGGAEALAESASAFERWCDNRIIETIRPQKYNPFSIGPIVAYVIARQNEIKTVRIILSGKLNDMPEKSIRERVRQMYV